MKYEIINKIYNDPNLLRYLRENSYWYKKLNRGVDINIMIKEMKEKYELTLKKRIDKVGTGLDLLNAFVNVTKE